jgi:hypothetical protein
MLYWTTPRSFAIQSVVTIPFEANYAGYAKLKFDSPVTIKIAS